MEPHPSMITGERVRNIPRQPLLIEAGTPMCKPVPPRLVEPYLTGRRTVIAGFAYRAADCAFSGPGEYYEALDLGYEGSDFLPDMPELYLLRWLATGPGGYLVPYSVQHGATGRASRRSPAPATPHGRSARSRSSTST